MGGDLRTLRRVDKGCSESECRNAQLIEFSVCNCKIEQYRCTSNCMARKSMYVSGGGRKYCNP